MKNLLKAAAIGIGLGLLLSIVQNGLRMNRTAFLYGYWITIAALLVGAILVSIFYNRSYRKKMQQLTALLEEGKPQGYLDGVKGLLLRAKGKNLRNILQINLSAGYFEVGQYGAAIEVLEGLPEERLAGNAAKLVRRLNLCMSYFYAAQDEKAMALYEESQPLFGQFRNNTSCGGNIAALDVLAALRQGRLDQAEQLLETAKQSWDHPRLRRTFQRIGGFLEEARAERQEGGYADLG